MVNKNSPFRNDSLFETKIKNAKNEVNRLSEVVFDKKIAKFLENNHNFNQIPDVMLQILQLGTFELQFMKKNPTKVVINEYVNITNSFFDKKKTDFVNAVLDKISKEQVL